MDKTEFWKMIDITHKGGNGNPFKQSELMTDALLKLSEAELLEYDTIFRALMDEAYVVDLWEAAYIIGCGCGDDGFMDFRGWLIGQGKETFEKALLDPESLVDLVERGSETQEGNLFYVAPNVYEIITGKDLPPISGNPPKLKGQPSGDEKLLLSRFPKLFNKFWKKCQEQFN